MPNSPLNEILKLLSDENNRTILALTKNNALTPTDLIKYFNFTSSALSNKLKVLTQYGLLKKTRYGNNLLYQFNIKQKDPLVQSLLDSIFNISLNKGLQDLAKKVEEEEENDT